MGNINKKSCADQIYEDIRNDILKHNIGFYDKLVNRDLQTKYDVSSTPVRDAVNRLYLDGLISEISKTGARTIGFDRKYALEINEVMGSVMDSAIGFAAKKCDIQDACAQLNTILNNQKEPLMNDKFYYYDRMFHRVFFQYSDNEIFLNLYDKYSTLMELMYNYIAKDDSGFKKNEIACHQAIVKEFSRGDIFRARELMRDHYLFVVPIIEKFFKQ